MSNADEEVVILEKVAAHQRRAQPDPGGLLSLTNKRVIFQPSILPRALRLLLQFISVLIILFGSVMFLGFLGSYGLYGGSSGSIAILLLAILLIGPGILVILLTSTSKKVITIELKNIVEVGKTGGKSWIKLGGGRIERFTIRGRDDFLDEVKFALRSEPVEVPSSLVVTPDLNVPKYSVPQKYPGALVRLQRTYLTPKTCCMCSEPAPKKTIVTNPSASNRSKEGNAAWGPYANLSTPSTHPFPICNDCNRVHRRAKIAGSLGGAIGLFAGGTIFVLLLLYGRLILILGLITEFVDAVGVAPVGGVMLFLLSIALSFVILAGLGWAIAKALAISFALRPVPKEKQAFYKVVAENKGIRVLRSPGFVAFGFLSKEFATVFGQMNRGVATAVGVSAEEKKKIRKNKLQI